jgi:L-lactate dehydrogenase complex protein LldF
MTAFARRTLRPRFLSADLGITGVNLGVAETGTLLTVTNEGNGRLTAGAPPVHVAVMGMERVVANWAEADLLLALVARAGAGVRFATYVNCVTGPRRATAPRSCTS